MKNAKQTVTARVPTPADKMMVTAMALIFCDLFMTEVSSFCWALGCGFLTPVLLGVFAS